MSSSTTSSSPSVHHQQVVFQSPPIRSSVSRLHDQSTPTGNNASKLLQTPVRRICIVGEQLRGDGVLEEQARRFGVPVHYSADADEHISTEDISDVAFVLPDFAGRAFEALNALEATIMGPTAIAELSKPEEEEEVGPPTLYMSTRPLFSTSMRGLCLCFNGYRNKDNKKDLKRFLFMIHSMGGRVLADVTLQKPKVTHLVTNNCKGDKYTYASTFEIPIMQDGWIAEAWRHRKEVGFVATEDSFQSQWKVKPFHGASVYFLGFQEEERRDMSTELRRNGGEECLSYQDPRCTHVVVDNMSSTHQQSIPADVRRDVHVVKVEWFWASIQMDVCAEEKMHLFADYIGSFASPRPTCFSPSTPGSHGRRKKRRTEAVRQLAQSDELGGGLLLQQNNAAASSSSSSSSKKARSSLGDLAATSTSFGLAGTSGSLLLDTPDKNKADSATPTKEAIITSPQQITSPKPVEARPRSARQQVFEELVQTEENYVRILSTIVEIFKEPLEDPKMQLLNQTEMKIIFGNVPPILQVHAKMLSDLASHLQDWKEHYSVGNVVLRYADDLMSVYPPFVNFFENTKRTLDECDKTNPRFHAFLKVCQSRRECGRQTLAELLIRPVQRLGSITLLLQDLLKHTMKEKDHSDGPALEAALAKVKEVLLNINEDKRKTEGQVHIFEIFSDIENCPPHLVSSHRSFLSQVDVVELGGSDELCGKGSDLTLFLFSDVLEISKRRRHNVNRMMGLASKSPSTMSLRNSGLTNVATGGAQVSSVSRPHKHVDLMNLNAIRRVVDLVDNEECQDCFTLVCRTNQELKERMFVFQIVSEDVRKGDFLKQLCRNVANTMYRQDPTTYLVQMRPDDLGLALSDLNIAKASYRNSLHRVKKAFSFNRTPTTSRLTRAVSSMISPLTSSNSYSRGRISSTPSGDLQSLRLQSCTNLMDSPLRGATTMTPGRRFPLMGPPPPSPAQGFLPSPARGGSSSTVSESPGSDSRSEGGFTVPRTPTMCVRRASFKFLTNSLGKKY